MKTCPKCHEEMSDDRRICRRCGGIVPVVEPAESPAEPDTLDAEVVEEREEVGAADEGTSPEREAMLSAIEAADSNLPAEGEWTCAKCASPVPRDFAACWHCGTTKEGTEDPGFPALHAGDKKRDVSDGLAHIEEPMGRGPHGGVAPGSEPNEAYRRVSFRRFQSRYSSWDQLCHEAAGFAASVGPSRLVSISHSEDNNDGVIMVWYWS